MYLSLLCIFPCVNLTVTILNIYEMLPLNTYLQYPIKIKYVKSLKSNIRTIYNMHYYQNYIP